MVNTSEPAVLPESLDLAWQEVDQDGLATLCILDMCASEAESISPIIWKPHLLIVEGRRTMSSGDVAGRNFTRIIFADETLDPVFSRRFYRNRKPRIQRIGLFHLAELSGQWKLQGA